MKFWNVFILSIFAVVIFVAALTGTGFLAAAEPDWQSFAPSSVKAPVFEKKTGGGLSIELPDDFSYGQWNGSFAVTPGKGCRISADAVSAEKTIFGKNKVMMILSWYPSKETKNPIQRDYVSFVDYEKGERRFDSVFNVPKEVKHLVVECIFKWEKGKVLFKSIKVEPASPLSKRPVRLAALKTVPVGGSIEDNLAALDKTLKAVCEGIEKLDLVLCSECFSNGGVNKPVEENSEAVPGGPTYTLLSRYAKKYHTYIVGNVLEKSQEGHCHNTAFIIDRNGQFVGRYRKVHLTMTESAKGVIPGSEFPVFDLDFGRVGIVICWDNWFVESARQIRLNGAELLLFPLAGDGKKSHYSAVWSARAIDNSIPMLVATRGTDAPSALIDRDGEWLAMTFDRTGYVSGVVDLADRKRSFWLSVGPSDGDPYQLYLKERRPETYRHFQKTGN